MKASLWSVSTKPVEPVKYNVTTFRGGLRLVIRRKLPDGRYQRMTLVLTQGERREIAEDEPRRVPRV